MRKVSNRLFLLFVVLSFAFGAFLLTGCTSEESKNALKLSFEEKEYVLEVGEQIEIAPVVTNAGEEQINLVWKSYNSSVVLVNDGVLEGVSVGKTEVKVYVSGKQNVFATVTVKVTAKDNKPVATFNDVPEILYVGDEFQLTHELANPENECEIVYQSLTDAATIDQTGLITVVEEGYGLVTVKATDKVTGQYVSYNFAFKVLTNYDIIYVLDGGINNEQNPSFYISDQKDIVLKEPSKLGWKFLGWFEDEELTKPISVINVDRKENITIYASWEAITYEIEYIVNGGSLPIDAKFEYQYCVGYELPVPIKLPTDKEPLEGYMFGGWYDNEKFEGQSITAVSTTDEGNKTYYAKWVDTILIEVEEPIEGEVYKFGMYQKGLQKWLWMTGSLDGYYGSSVDKYYNSADVQVVKVDGGYNLKVIKVDGSIVYINAESSGDYNNIKFDSTPNTVWAFDQDYNTFVATITNGKVYMGTYTNTSKNQEHDTFGLSLISYAENATSYIAHLYEEVADTPEVRAELALKELTLKDKMVQDCDLPVVENVVWELLDGKGVAILENGKLVVTRPEIGEEDVEIVVTAKYELNGTVVKTKEFKVLVLAEEPILITNAVAIFSFGANGNSGHVDGSTLGTSKTYTEGSYTLALTSMSCVYGSSFDSTGNSCLKIGKGDANGQFSFTVAENVVKVEIYVGQYKTNTTTVSVNGTQYNITTASDEGKYTAIEIDTTVEKTITFATVSSKYRCMINQIVYYGYTEDTSITDQLTAESILSNVTVDKTSLIEDYKLPVYENIDWKLNENYAAAKIENGVLKVTRPEYEDGDAVVKLVAVCKINQVSIEKTFEIVVIAKEDESGSGENESKLLATFNLGANGSASHSDGSSKTTYTETVNGYKLNITNGSQFYTGARDAKGNSCLKLGSSKNVGSFKFTAPSGVNKVVIYVAKYKSNTTKIKINSTTYTISNASDNGKYDVIEIDVSSNKSITFTTDSGGKRCMINTIEFYS